MTPTQKTIDAIHAALLRNLLIKIESGDAAAADLTLAWNICKDNGVKLEDLAKLVEEPPVTSSLPFQDEEEGIQDSVVVKVG